MTSITLDQEGTWTMKKLKLWSPNFPKSLLCISMLKKHKKNCRRGLTHLDATPIFEKPFRYLWDTLYIYLDSYYRLSGTVCIIIYDGNKVSVSGIEIKVQFWHQCHRGRAVGRSENPSVPVLNGGHNLPPMDEIGLTDLPLGTTPLQAEVSESALHAVAFNGFDKIKGIFFSTYLSSKLDSPLIKTSESIRFSPNQNIGEGESNYDDNTVCILESVHFFGGILSSFPM